MDFILIDEGISNGSVVTGEIQMARRVGAKI
jgi:hypothetical protein